MNTKNSFTRSLLQDMLKDLSGKIIKEGFDFAKSIHGSIIRIGEYDPAYPNVNKLIYRMDKVKYERNRVPSTSKESYELTEGSKYNIKLGRSNYITVYVPMAADGAVFPEKKLVISFHGNLRYEYRAKFLIESLRLTDNRHIRVKYLNNSSIQYDIDPHPLDSIVLQDSIRAGIIKNLNMWKNSKCWYKEHNLIYKTGVLLYGKPGTGKSTVVRAISTMFGNCPILILDTENIMDSIASIIRTRKRQNGVLIVLIEDIDMLFCKREDIDEGGESEDDKSTDNAADGSVIAAAATTLKKEKKRSQKQNTLLNATFQLLDGVYSTDETIYIATTNFRERLDDAMVRHGRFDMQYELEYFDKSSAVKFVEMFGYPSDILDEMNIAYPVQPALLQSYVMEYRSNELNS